MYPLVIGKLKAAWTRTAVQTSWLLAALTGKDIHPHVIIPRQFRPKKPPKPVKSRKQKEFESKHAWKLIDQWIGNRPVMKIRPQKKEK